MTEHVKQPPTMSKDSSQVSLNVSMVSTDVTKLLQASTFAAEKHKFQKRKDPEGTPYINHPLGVALLLAEAGVNDIDALMAAILHDTVEVFMK